MEDNRFERFCSLTGSAAKSIARLKAARMNAFDLSAAHTQCLCMLHEAMPEGLTQTELARRIGMDRAQVSRVLHTLRDRGDLPSDAPAGYKHRHTLTEAGMNAADAVQAIVAQVHAYVSEGIPQEDLVCFYRTFGHIAQRLERAVTLFGTPDDPTHKENESRESV